MTPYDSLRRLSLWYRYCVTGIRPSETSEGQLWLGNFPPEDVARAEILLNSLHFVSENAFRAGLISLLADIIAEVPEENRTVLYPVRPAPSNATYAEPSPERPWGPDDGSEHIVANIITEVVRTFSGSRQVSALETLEGLRSRAARRVILVDDYLGSGSSVMGYLDRWWANRSVKSWRSFGWMEFVVATYACSSRAKQLQHHRLVDGVRWVEFGLDFPSAHWTDEERDAIRHLCLKYANNRSMALGFKRSEGLLVMGHTVPNNLPQIFRHGSGPNGPWRGFFPSGVRRMSPEQQVKLSDYRPGAGFSALAGRLNRPEIAEGSVGEDLRARPLLLLLAALSRSLRTDERLIQELGWTIFELQSLMATAQALALVDERRHLTDQGRATLRHAGVRARNVRFQLQGSSKPYYPIQLRGVHDI